MASANESLSPRSAVLTSLLVDPAHKALLQAELAKTTDIDVVLSQLASKLSSDEVRKLSFANSVAAWADDDSALVTHILAARNVTSLRDVALNFGAAELATIVSPNSIPAQITGATSEEKTSAYAVALHNKLFDSETSAVVQRMVTRQEIPIADAGVRNSVAGFFAQNPQFNLRQTSILTALRAPDALAQVPAAQRPAVIEQLKTLQRVQAISHVPEAVPALVMAGITSAFQAAAMPATTFVRALSSSLDSATASVVHANAISVQIRNEHALTSLRQTIRGTGLAVIDAGKPLSDRLSTAQTAADTHGLPLDLSTLFGSLDECECDDCLSVYSPAAYYVELLQYLRNNDLGPDPATTNPDPTANKNIHPGVLGTPVEKLFRRRPDLACLELSCENTFTVLPYLDLVNEVMESFVVHEGDFVASTAVPKQVTLDTFNVEDETSGELLAAPQHTNYEAYCILKSAVFPFTLPYHQPIDATRIYLGPLGTSRVELLDYCRTPTEAAATSALPAAELAELASLHQAVIERAIDAESLGLIQEEYIILTEEAFWPKRYFDLTQNQIFAQADYRKKIGVRDPWKYYGYPTESAMLDGNTDATSGRTGLSFVKWQYLPRTGLLYADLVALLQTRFINPNYPTGRALTIFEAIPFSYRFLQSLVVGSASDPQTRYVAVVATILAGEALQALIKAQSEPGLCPPAMPCACEPIDEASVKAWVHCWFERIGQLIVLDSEEGPQLSVSGDLYRESESPVMFGHLRADGTILDLDGKLIGQVDALCVARTTDGKPLTDTYGSEIIIEDGDGNYVGFIRAAGISSTRERRAGWLPARDTCDIEKVILVHLDGSSVTAAEYDRMHRFIRLWRRLGWTIAEVDQALEGLAGGPGSGGAAGSGSGAGGGGVGVAAAGFIGFDEFVDECDAAGDTGCDPCPPATGGSNDKDCPELIVIDDHLSPDFIHQLRAVQTLRSRTGLALPTLLAFWAPIATRGDNSLYASLFLSHAMQSIDPVFRPDANGAYLTGTAKLTDHLPVLMAAFRLKADDITAIMNFASLPDALTIANVSVIYRHAQLARLLQIPVSLLKDVADMFGNPFANAWATLDLLTLWGRMQDAGFTFRQLDYVLQNRDDALRPLAPSRRTLLSLSKALFDGLNAIDTEHQDLASLVAATTGATAADIATDALVRAKTSLIFDQDTVGRILALLDGQTVFVTNAPAGLAVTVPPALATKLVYTQQKGAIPPAATLQSTGILTDAEAASAKTLNAQPGWSDAIDRLVKQKQNLFSDVLFGIFADPNAARTALLVGDYANPADPSDPANTAPAKRMYFLAGFIPFLRDQLDQRLIIDKLSAVANLSNSMTSLLLTQILTVGTPPIPAMQAFKAIKTPPASSGAGWTGYLIPPADGAYIFTALGDTQPPAMALDGVVITLSVRQDDPSNVWSSDAATPATLKAGQLYRLSLSDRPADQLQWKTARSPRAPIPSAALLPDYTSAATGDGLTRLVKAGILISGFALIERELTWFTTHPADFNGFDLNAPTLKQWTQLLDYTGLRDALPATGTTLIDLFAWTANPDDPTKLAAWIASATGWDPTRIASLIAPDHFNLPLPGSFRNEVNLIKLSNANGLVAKLGVEVARLFDWAKPGTKFWACHRIAEDIRKALRARYTEDDWEQFIKPFNDALREDQKQALIAYLLVQPSLRDWGVIDADGLFEFFLIDVQMDACMETSRIKQAISSVQLFVQRCMLGLEERKDSGGGEVGVGTGALDRDRWSWMQRYRVWEANRKVFLYPENWLKPELRDDKSEFYQDLEAALLRKDISAAALQAALLDFVHKVHDIGNLKVIGLHRERLFDINNQPVLDAAGNYIFLRLHLFARTRNTPFIIYYRRYEFAEGNWYPWEKVPVDVPSYEIFEATGELTERGTYLIPIAYHNRLFIFFPEFTRKPVPAKAADTQVTTGAPQSGVVTTNVQDDKGQSFFEIKMGMSEYRRGVWAPKQISSNALVSEPFSNNAATPLSQYFFAPDIDLTYGIDIFYTVYSASPTSSFFRYYQNELKGDNSPVIVTVSSLNANFQYIKSKEITGAQIHFGSAIEFLYLDFPRVEDGGVGSNLLLDAATSVALDAKFAEGLMQAAAADSVPALTQYISTGIAAADQDDAFGAYTDADGGPSHHELKRPNSVYIWEAGFHAQMAFIDKQMKAGQYEAALGTCQQILSPFVPGSSSDPTRFWLFPPFQITVDNLLQQLFTSLQPGKPYDPINEWRNNPFQPHVVARSRPAAYMMWVAMTYIEILIAWGDSLYVQDTIETINQATQLYILASHVYGPRREKIPKRGKVAKQSYYSLLDKWDAFGNAMVQLELAAPLSNQTPLPFGFSNGVPGFANIFGFATTLYFCIPDNPNLTALRDTIDDRLFKIRHCENIAGVFQQLPLFEPPIDPGLLVEATAEGISLATVLSDLNSPMPNYRFYYLLQKAIELCSELKSLGSAYLSACEKDDGEAMARLRAGHESTINTMMLSVRQQQRDEAAKSLDALEQSRKTPVYRLQHYLKLIGQDLSLVPDEATDFTELDDSIEAPVDDSGLKLVSYEKEEMDKADAARDWQIAIGITETLAAILHVIPSAYLNALPFGLGATSKVTGGTMLGNAAQAVARGMQTYASDLSFQSSGAGRKAGFLRQLQDRVLQANVAGYEIKAIDKQIITQKLRMAIADQEIAVQQTQIDNAAEIVDFLKNKYSRQELYQWMEGEVSGLYHQLYGLAYDLATRAEKLFRFERGLTSSAFIQYGYWDPAHDGLLAGERLYNGLKQLEAAYQEERGYDFEISKQISLQQLDPLALMRLRETGTCEFELPEVLFDMGWPGQYMRRIKTVSLTFSCLVGPATSVNCTLRLLNHRFRFDPMIAGGYAEQTDSPDPRFMTTNVPLQAVAISTGQADSGVFDLNFRDERYLPFEGAGVISRWRIELPAAWREFDYESITELVMQLRYTARDGGAKLAGPAAAAVSAYARSVEELSRNQGLFALFDLSRDFANAWYKAGQPQAGVTDRILALDGLTDRLPAYTRNTKPGKIVATDVTVFTVAPLTAADLVLTAAGGDTAFTDGPDALGMLKSYVAQPQAPMTGWSLKLGAQKTIVDRAWLVVRYTLGA